MFTLTSGPLTLSIDGAGHLASAHISGGAELLLPGSTSPLLQLRVGGKLLEPTVAKMPTADRLTLTFPGHTAVIAVTHHATHVSLELVKVTPKGDVELAVWGPYQTALHDQIGETIGVVQGKGQAFGLQILNVKTLGGFPNTEDDVEPSYSIFDSGNPVDLTGKAKESEDYRGDTARPIKGGSSIQAYTRNRSQTRIIANWDHPFYTAPAYDDGGVIGSKIALFGCPSPQALKTIGQIEVDEGLPHPMLDGVWAKESPTAHESYLIMGFDTKNLDACLALTKAAGLRYLYSDSCFDTWGHFKLHPEGFPNNWDSMKTCVERAKAQGVRLGVHTLSNFITTNDAYVTPVPDARLAEVGESTLSIAVDEKATDLTVADPKFFNEMKNNTLRTVRVGAELIQYAKVNDRTLVDCKRGMFGTQAAAHPGGATIAKLMDHGYGVFLTNAALSKEVAANIAHLFNQAGLLQLSMDGLEGNWSTGMGQYGRAIFAKAWYDALDKDEQGEVINDASNPGAFNWHINSRYNWGEPWYAGFRKSQTQYRLKNQRYFKRNFLPGMLGWFSLTSETTPEDIHWLLARAAGFDAGFCITTSLDAVRHNPHIKEILAAVKAWETARRLHAFPADLIPQLQDINREFELTQVGVHDWSLVQYASDKFTWSGGEFKRNYFAPRIPAGSKLILQVPAKASLENLAVMVDDFLLSDKVSKVVNGYAYLSFDLSGRRAGPHVIHMEGKLTGPKDATVDCELRTPYGDYRVLSRTGVNQ